MTPSFGQPRKLNQSNLDLTFLGTTEKMPKDYFFNSEKIQNDVNIIPKEY